MFIRVRFGVVGKLVAATLLGVFLVVGAVVLAAQWTFQAGFADYLVQAEVERLQPLLDRLAERYEQNGNWRFLRGRHDVWNELLRETLNEGWAGPAPPRPGMPPRLGRGLRGRLQLFDAEGRPVVGGAGRRPAEVAEPYLIPVVVAGTPVGMLQLATAPLPTQGPDREFRRDQVRALYLIATAAILFALAIAVPLGRHFLRPVRQLAAGARALAAGDYATRVVVRRQDELGRLAEDFNQLAAVLERTEAMRREGMANISHELRTPLATLKAEIEAMEDGIRPLDANQLKSLSGSVVQLSRLVDDLYQLALADVGALVYRQRTVRLDNLVEEATQAVRAAMARQGLALGVDLEPGIVVEGDAIRLRQLLDNLLQNSRSYTDPGGGVWVTLRRQGRAAELAVADTAPAVPAVSLSRLFERFYRVEASRSRGSGGAGLGLALVKAIAEAHRGRVSAEPAEQGGLRVAVVLPMAEEKMGDE